MKKDMAAYFVFSVVALLASGGLAGTDEKAKVESAANQIAAASAGNGLELVQYIKEEKDKDPHILSRKGGFFHVFPITWRGDYVYAATHYEGLINIFRRDPTGGLAYVDHLAFDDPKPLAQMSISDFVWANGRLYFFGGAGHCTGDGDSRGLHWLEANTTTGMLTPKGHLDIPLGGGLVTDASQKNLYLLLGYKKMIVHYRLAVDGTPEKADESVLKDAPAGRLYGLVMTGDGKALYTYCPADAPMPGKPAPASIMEYAEIKADGSVGNSGACALKEVTDGLTWEKDGKPRGWGWCINQDWSFSPDGRFCYVPWTSDPKDKAYHRLALYARTPPSNELKFVEMLDVAGADKIASDRLLPTAFEPDGVTCYAKGGVWLTRDPKTGRLAFGGQLKDAGETSPLYLDAASGYLYGGCWAKQGLTVMWTGKKTPAGGK